MPAYVCLSCQMMLNEDAAFNGKGSRVLSRFCASDVGLALDQHVCDQPFDCECRSLKHQVNIPLLSEEMRK